MDYFFIQNLQCFYPKLIKTRRYKSMLKFILAPKLFCLLVDSCVYFHSLSRFSFLFLTKSTFFTKQVFLLYKSLVTKDLGLLTNTVTRSYTHWCLRLHLEFLLQTPSTNIFNQSVNLVEYSTSIQVVGYSLKKKTFSQIMMYILFNFVKLNSSFLNYFLITNSYIAISREFSFIYFYNFFYFKIYNY